MKTPLFKNPEKVEAIYSVWLFQFHFPESFNWFGVTKPIKAFLFDKATSWYYEFVTMNFKYLFSSLITFLSMSDLSLHQKHNHTIRRFISRIARRHNLNLHPLSSTSKWGTKICCKETVAPSTSYFPNVARIFSWE